MKQLVSIKHGYEPAQMAYDAIKRVFVDDAKGKKVLLKPNAGRKGDANTALCTSPEVIRGVIRFFKDLGAGEILVGDGALWGVDVHEAMEMAGITKVCNEENVVSVNLDDYPPVTKEIENGIMVDRLRFSSLPFQMDFVVSIPVIKTHMYTGATLGIKNMKGCLYRMEKTILHRIDKPNPQPEKGKCLDIGVGDMSTVLLPDYVVLDGTTCMEGFGPAVGNTINLDVVVASKDPTAADYVGMSLMGMDKSKVSHVSIVQERCGTASYEEIQAEPDDYLKFAKKFQTADMTRLSNLYPYIDVIEKGTCSACSATIMAFIKNHGSKFNDKNKLVLATGKDLEAEDLLKECLVLVGNCAGQSGNGLPFCKGCPPVGSGILKFIEEQKVEMSDDN